MKDKLLKNKIKNQDFNKPQNIYVYETKLKSITEDSDSLA